MSVELWKPVVGFEKFYEVSSLGRVRRIAPDQGTRPGYILRPTRRRRDGYKVVSLHTGTNKRKKATVHRLVAAAFYGPHPDLLVRHLDGDPANNDLSNLRFGTPFENAQDRAAHGRTRSSNQNKGKTHCIRGHEFTPENTRIRLRPNGSTSRHCRACLRAQRREHKARQRS